MRWSTSSKSLHGQLAADADEFEIWIENFRLRWAADDHALVTYEEWHRRRGATSARLSSALFRRDAAASCGVAWLHVHETWLPGLAPEGGERFPGDLLGPPGQAPRSNEHADTR